MKIISNLLNLRRQLNISQESLANYLNVSRQTINSIENNRTSITLEFAFKISQYFNKPIEEIFEIENDDNFRDDIDYMRRKYGKHTLIIKNNLIFRCGTGTIEIGPKCLLNYDLPNYGQMKKFVVINDSIYQLMPVRKYISRTDIVHHNILNKENIDIASIDFDEKKAWNYKKCNYLIEGDNK